jgi:hypothetical protein
MWIRLPLDFDFSDFHFPTFDEHPGVVYAGFKSKKKRGGLTAAPKTTARKGTSKSAKARAVAQQDRSSAAGRAGASSGASRTLGEPAQIERYTNRGPGDIGAVGGSRDRAGRSGAPKRGK